MHNNFNNNIVNEDQNPLTEMQKIISNHHERLQDLNTDIVKYLNADKTVTKEIYYQIYNECQVLTSTQENDYLKFQNLFDSLSKANQKLFLSSVQYADTLKINNILKKNMGSLSSKYYNAEACYCEMREID